MTEILNENDLQLVVSNKTLGSLTTNAEKIREMVKSALPQYSIENYSSDDIAKAKEDKAKLNKAAKVLNDRRIEIEKEWMKPFGDFKDVVSETVTLIKQCVSEIDKLVKADDERTKAEKKEQIERLAETLGVEELGIHISKIWNDKWLNKTVSIKTITTEMGDRLTAIKADLETLKTFSEDYEVLATYYKDGLNLNDTIAYANRLKQAREAKAQQQAQEEAKASEQSATKTPEQPAVKPAEQPKHVDDDADVNDAFAAAMGIDVTENKVTYNVEVPKTMAAGFEEYLNKFGLTFKII